jgi:hypothetical protein
MFGRVDGRRPSNTHPLSAHRLLGLLPPVVCWSLMDRVLLLLLPLLLFLLLLLGLVLEEGEGTEGVVMLEEGEGEGQGQGGALLRRRWSSR